MEVLKEANELTQEQDLNALIETDTLAPETSGKKEELTPEMMDKIMKFIKSKQPGNGKQQKKRNSAKKRKSKRTAQKQARRKNR